jgi:hypothetical protein
MVRLPLLAIMLALVACASNNPPMAQGPWRQLNQGKWAFHENALTEPPAGLTR